jgi:hypothetical protein
MMAAGRDALLAPVEHRAAGVPGAEHRLDGQFQLLARILREVVPGVLGEDLLVRADQVPQVVRVELHVVADPLGRLGLAQRALELVARHVADGLAEHLDQPPVRVPGEPVVAAGRRAEPGHRLVVEADVEHRLHHAGHREPGPGTHRHQQRVGRVAQPAAHRRLQRGEVPGDLLVQSGRPPAGAEIALTGHRGDGETGRHRQPEIGHFREVGAFATEQILEVLVAFGEVVDELLGRYVALHRRPPPVMIHPGGCVQSPGSEG